MFSYIFDVTYTAWAMAEKWPNVSLNLIMVSFRIAYSQMFHTISTQYLNCFFFYIILGHSITVQFTIWEHIISLYRDRKDVKSLGFHKQLKPFDVHVNILYREAESNDFFSLHIRGMLDEARVRAQMLVGFVICIRLFYPSQLPQPSRGCASWRLYECRPRMF